LRGGENSSRVYWDSFADGWHVKVGAKRYSTGLAQKDYGQIQAGITRAFSEGTHNILRRAIEQQYFERSLDIILLV
jgi:DICT domain-containing protein